jgi:hypothetical protein
MKPVAEFAILQNSKTRRSGVWNGKRWAYPPIEDYNYVGLLVKLIRTDPNPVEIARAINNETK